MCQDLGSFARFKDRFKRFNQKMQVRPSSLSERHIKNRIGRRLTLICADYSIEMLHNPRLSEKSASNSFLSDKLLEVGQITRGLMGRNQVIDQ